MGAQTMIKKIGTLLESNKSINTAFDFLAEGGENMYKAGKMAMSNESTFGKAVDKVYKVAESEGSEVMKWNKKAIAGSALTGAIGLRVLGGGGLYRDRHGNNDIIGIPGI